MSALRRPKVSIIIPFYKVESYIAECLDSVVSQTLEEIEILCINDASPDGSADIVRQYVERDPRVKYLENEVNSGVSVARNKGLEAATGAYLYIMDSDDFLDRQAMEKMYNKAVECDADIVLCDAWKYHAPERMEIYHRPHRHKRHEQWLGHAAWWFMFRRGILEKHPDIRFQQGVHPTEDTVFSFMLFSQIQKHTYINEPLIFYRQHAEMCMELIKAEKRDAYLASIMLSLDHLRLYMQHHPEIAKTRKRAYIALAASMISDARGVTGRALSGFPIRIRILLLGHHITSFLISWKITNSERLLVKICKIPVFRKKIG